MWLFVKLFIALVTFFIRLEKKFFRTKKNTLVETFGTTQISHYTVANKQKITATIFEIPFDCKSIFKLTEEGKVDAFFKSLGLAKEFQTKHAEFNNKIYIACDSLNFLEEINKDDQAKTLILELFQRDCKFISCDGSTLSVCIAGDKQTDSLLKTKIAELHHHISDMKHSAYRFFQDPFVYKILVIESLIWSLAAYAYSTFFEWQFFQEDIHLHAMPLFKQGLALGLVITLFLFALITLLLRNSSRGHRILVESFLVLFCSIPVGGIGLIADINTHFDKSEAIVVEGKVIDVYKQLHRRRRSTYYTYHLHVDVSAKTSEIEIPRNINVSYDTFSKFKIGDTAILSIGKGYLKHPWFKSIQSKTQF